MKHKYLYILLCLFSIVLMDGCKSQQRAAQQSTAQQQNSKKSNPLDAVIAAQPQFNAAYSTNAKIAVEYSQRKVSATADINIVTDSAIRISAKVFGIEMVILHITPDNITIIDKLNKRYTETTYAELKSKSNINITFENIQSLLCNRIFAVGTTNKRIATLKPIYDSGATASTIQFTSEQIQHLFTYDNATCRLTETELKSQSGVNRVQIGFSEFKESNGISFPRQFMVSLQSGSTTGKANITMSNLEINNGAVVKKYDTRKLTKVSLSTIIPGL